MSASITVGFERQIALPLKSCCVEFEDIELQCAT